MLPARAPPSASRSPALGERGVSPGVKRGGPVQQRTHTIDLECLGRQHSAYIEADASTALNQSTRCICPNQLPRRRGVDVARRRDAGDARAAVRLPRRTEAAGRLPLLPPRCCCCSRCCSGAGAGAAPAAGCCCSGVWCEGACGWRQGTGCGGPTRRSSYAGCRFMRPVCRSGNPGTSTLTTRHNIGFAVVDEVRSSGFAPWLRRFQGETSEGTLERERVSCSRPRPT